MRVTVRGERDRCCPIRHPSIALRSGPRLVIFFLLPAQSPALPRRDGRRGLAASRSVAWQSLATSMVIVLVTATSDLCRATMHGVAQVFGRARVIGVAKSVSFKKPTVLDLKLVLKKY